MREIAQTLREAEALQLQTRIEAAGIPVIITGRGASFAFRTGLVSVWVAIDAQYEDALRVLEHPDHVARQPVDVQAFHQQVRDTRLIPALLWRLNYPALLTYALIGGFALMLLRAWLRSS